MAHNGNTDALNDHTAAPEADDRAALFGDKLVQAVDAYARAQTAETIGTLCAELLGRCTSLINAIELRMLEIRYDGDHHAE